MARSLLGARDISALQEIARDGLETLLAAQDPAWQLIAHRPDESEPTGFQVLPGIDGWIAYDNREARNGINTESIAVTKPTGSVRVREADGAGLQPDDWFELPGGEIAVILRIEGPRFGGLRVYWEGQER